MRMMSGTWGAGVLGIFCNAAPVISPASCCAGGQPLASQHPRVFTSLVERKNFLLIPNLGTVGLVAVLAGHVSQARDSAYAASVPR